MFEQMLERSLSPELTAQQEEQRRVYAEEQAAREAVLSVANEAVLDGSVRDLRSRLLAALRAEDSGAAIKVLAADLARLDRVVSAAVFSSESVQAAFNSRGQSGVLGGALPMGVSGSVERWGDGDPTEKEHAE